MLILHRVDLFLIIIEIMYKHTSYMLSWLLLLLLFVVMCKVNIIYLIFVPCLSC